MKCKTCNLEINSDQSYSCSTPGICDFSKEPIFPVKLPTQEFVDKIYTQDKKIHHGFNWAILWIKEHNPNINFITE